MARRSQFEHLKPSILELFRQGATPGQVRNRYPDVAVSSLYVWHKEFQNDSRIVSESGEPSVSVEVEVMPAPSKLVAIDGAENGSDFALARTTLRGVAKDKQQPGSVRVQAALGLVKLVQLRAELPKHILEEKEQSSVDAERDRVRELPPEEIARRVREALG